MTEPTAEPADHPLTLEVAWRASGRAFGRDYPGHFPGSPEDAGYRAAEAERLERSKAMWAKTEGQKDPTIREDLKQAYAHHGALFGIAASIHRRFDRWCHARRWTTSRTQKVNKRGH